MFFDHILDGIRLDRGRVEEGLAVEIRSPEMEPGEGRHVGRHGCCAVETTGREGYRGSGHVGLRVAVGLLPYLVNCNYRVCSYMK